MKSTGVVKVEVRRQWPELQALPVRYLPVFEAFVTYQAGAAVALDGVHGEDSADKIAIGRLNDFLKAVKQDSPKATIHLSERSGHRPYQEVPPSRWFVD